MPAKFSNETFRNAPPTWANACVGDNGSPDVVEYAEGFADAAKVLLGEVLRHRGLKHPTDTFVYPICFNMRHSIELYLKAAIDVLRSLVHHELSLPKVDIDTSHDIGRLWAYFKEHSVVVDRRYRKVVEALDRDITDFAEVDATGQVFRYPFGRENQKHLTDLAIINLGVLWKKFGALIENLRTINYVGNSLSREYGYETYTAHLSRFDLICVAYRLPPKHDWNTHEFDEAKKGIRQHFDLSSNEFSRAVNLIKENLEMAAIIEAPRPLLYTNLGQLRTFFDSWRELHDLETVRERYSGAPPDLNSLLAEKDTFEQFIEGIEADTKIRDETWPRLMSEVTPEGFGEIEALLYFARDNMRYSEAFEEQRELSVRDFLADRNAGEARLRHSAFHLLDKTSALQHILNALLFFGHVETVTDLVHRYGLADCAGQLLEESSRWMREKHGEASEAMGEALRHPANATVVG
ncbi:hypothetical protein [Burkholderia cenocepacia]|uniref:hypothetical protein n=1 Tax=Burkholderia cenocepacia TaxID=95486 RepID=UPI000AE5B8BE|nr:hypothetical protein [Burkholderia cenocepacia]MBR7977713.1 hypothetical protein [Burkholderia cenocepacia]MBR7992224.1 hypothetical protein [Burkholderia cenocepacia]